MSGQVFYRTAGMLSDGSLSALWLAAGAAAGGGVAWLGRKLRRKPGRI